MGLIHYGWRPYEKRKLGHRDGHTPGRSPGRMRAEVGGKLLQSKEQILPETPRRNQLCLPRERGRRASGIWRH